jgi:hypothetical protein
MEKNSQKQSLFARIKCWFTGESKSACGGGTVKPSGDASEESKDPKVCSNGEIRF